jgi:L,D-transpeptidase catalytic domain/Putative peptidoglycan binding domain
MRRYWALFAVFLYLAIGADAAGAAEEQVTLDVVPSIAPYGSTVRLAASVTPARRTRVEVLRLASGAWQVIAAGETGDAGTYSFRITARRPGLYVARTDAVESPQALLRIRPLLTASFDGLAVLGASLRVEGRLRPAVAGRLTLTVRGRTRTVSLDGRGRYEERVPTGRAGLLEVTLGLRPAEGYVGVRRGLSIRVRAPILRVGARSPAVRFLEQRLRTLGYVLRGVDAVFWADTRDAVYAFQKVERLARDGVVGPRVWTRLRKARTPAPAVARGSHIEVDKARQVLFEVRRGRVVKIMHVSTGATGNTPVGRWRIYLKTPGYNSIGMYYSMYFLRGFAVHGYHSVPPWPASHGCVRMPIWFAPRIYARWPVGSVVWVFPTTARSSSLWARPADVRRAVPSTDAEPVGP